MSTHWFWFLLTVATVVWYSTITIYVAIKGAFDIRHMLDRLAERQENEGSNPPRDGGGSPTPRA